MKFTLKFVKFNSLILQFSRIKDNFDDSYKLRGGVHFVNELPSTPSGKIIRRLAKEIAWNLASKST